jgi:hypothetical protein
MTGKWGFQIWRDQTQLLLRRLNRRDVVLFGKTVRLMRINGEDAVKKSRLFFRAVEVNRGWENLGLIAIGPTPPRWPGKS